MTYEQSLTKPFIKQYNNITTNNNNKRFNINDNWFINKLLKIFQFLLLFILFKDKDYYKRKKLINLKLKQKKLATSYDEWKKISLYLDYITNKNNWKLIKYSNHYDFKLIESIYNNMKFLRLNKKFDELIFIIRTNWCRNLGNMGNVNLYRQSHIGTKLLIDDYINESKLSLETLINDSDLDLNYLLSVLQQTRKNIGRTALVLSGGGTFGLFHIGVLSTFFELDLLPRVISGSSAGAIIAAMLCTKNDKNDIPILINNVLKQNFNIFKDDDEKSESENFLIKFSRFFKNGTWYNNTPLINTMIKLLKDLTFREAYNRTGRILNITVSPASIFEQPRLLNNLTAPNVLIWSAVCASCSLPGIFPSSPLYEKDPISGETRIWNGATSSKFVDGSVDNDLPISRLSEMFNIDHIIACQVNIHVFPFLKLSLSCVGGDLEDEFSARIKQNLSSIYNFFSNEIIHFLEMGCELGIAKNILTKFRSVLSQQYSGDITILPDMKTLFKFNQLLNNPTPEIILREITNGARATWPKISIIKNHCSQEYALDKAINFLKGKIIVNSSLKKPLIFKQEQISLIRDPITLITNNPTTTTKTMNDDLIEDDTNLSFSLLHDQPNNNNKRSTSINFPSNKHNLINRRKSEFINHHNINNNHISTTITNSSSGNGNNNVMFLTPNVSNTNFNFNNDGYIPPTNRQTRHFSLSISSPSSIIKYTKFNTNNNININEDNDSNVTDSNTNDVSDSNTNDSNNDCDTNITNNNNQNTISISYDSPFWPIQSPHKLRRKWRRRKSKSFTFLTKQKESKSYLNYYYNNNNNNINNNKKNNLQESPINKKLIQLSDTNNNTPNNNNQFALVTSHFIKPQQEQNLQKSLYSAYNKPRNSKKIFYTDSDYCENSSSNDTTTTNSISEGINIKKEIIPFPRNRRHSVDEKQLTPDMTSSPLITPKKKFYKNNVDKLNNSKNHHQLRFTVSPNRKT